MARKKPKVPEERKLILNDVIPLYFREAKSYTKKIAILNELIFDLCFNAVDNDKPSQAFLNCYCSECAGIGSITVTTRGDLYHKFSLSLTQHKYPSLDTLFNEECKYYRFLKEENNAVICLYEKEKINYSDAITGYIDSLLSSQDHLAFSKWIIFLCCFTLNETNETYHYLNYISILLDKYLTGSTFPLNQSENKLSPYDDVLMNCNFVGRQKEFEDVRLALSRYNKLFIYGMGGIGKSEFAREFAYRNKDIYTVYIFHYETNLRNMIINATIPGLDLITRNIDDQGNPESDKKFFERKLQYIKSKFDSKTLFIIDNFDTDYDIDLESILKGRYALIFTTRNNFEYLGIPTYHMTELNCSDQKELFYRYSHGAVLAADEQIYKLCSLFSGHTLAIILFASFLYQKRIPIKKMIENLCYEGLTSKIKGKIRIGYQKPSGVYDHIKELFHLDVLTAQEKSLMVCMTLIPLYGIPLNMAMRLCQEEDCEDIIRLCERCWIQYNSKNDSISMHPLISSIVNEELEMSEPTCGFFLEKFSNEIADTWSISVEKKQVYSDICSKLIKHIELLPTHLTLYFRIAQLSRHMEQYENCGMLLQKIQKETLIVFGKESIQLSEVYFELSNYAFSSNKADMAEHYIMEAITIMEKKDKKSLEMAIYQKFRAWILLDDYTTNEKLKTVDDSLKITKEILDSIEENPHHRGSLYSALAYLHYRQEEYEEALEYADQSLEIYMKLYGEVHPDTLSPMAVKASILAKLHKFQKAESLAKRTIEIQKELFPENHITILRRIAGLAIIYIESKELEKAKKCLADILSILKSNHINNGFFYNQIISMLNLCL